MLMPRLLVTVSAAALTLHGPHCSQVATEAEFLGIAGASKSPTIAREPFVAVMMRRRLYDVDYDSFLQRHPEERVFP